MCASARAMVLRVWIGWMHSLFELDDCEKHSNMPPASNGRYLLSWCEVESHVWHSHLDNSKRQSFGVLVVMTGAEEAVLCVSWQSQLTLQSGDVKSTLAQKVILMLTLNPPDLIFVWHRYLLLVEDEWPAEVVCITTVKWCPSLGRWFRQSALHLGLASSLSRPMKRSTNRRGRRRS